MYRNSYPIQAAVALVGWPPRRLTACSISFTLTLPCAAERAVIPKIAPSSARPPIQARATQRSSRTTSRALLSSKRVCALTGARRASTAAPASRRPARTTESPTVAMISTAMGKSATGRAPVSGRRFSTQPSGLAQRIQLAPATESATRRITNAAARTAAASPLAWRRVGASWLVSAPIARNMAALAVAAVA